MRTALSKVLTLLIVFALTFGILRNWVGVASTTYAAVPPQANSISVPVGTRILIRLAETLDSAQQRSGARFTGRLETNVTVGGTVVAPQGATVHGRVVSAQSAGRMAGGSELALELTDIVINGTAHPVMTTTYQLQGQGQGGRTARRVTGGAGLGSVIGALAGGGTGAAIGAAAGAGLGTAGSAAGRGQQVGLAQGTLLEFRLQHPAMLPRLR
jgi:hypothetical protein